MFDWSPRQDGVLLSESSHFTFVYDDPEYSLVVLNASPEHSGVYTCTAKNLAGSNSCKAELTVHTGVQSNNTSRMLGKKASEICWTCVFMIQDVPVHCFLCHIPV